MPHMPDSHHDIHDLELVAAFAAGDATGAGLETVTALVASCADCAALHHDLRAIAAALPTIEAPARPRDFRLTPEQAASLRPTGIRGILAAFASPRLSFATPLGTGLAALGIVGVLVASGGLPVGGAVSGEQSAAQAPVASGAPAPISGGAAAPTLEIMLASPAAEDAALAPDPSPDPSTGPSAEERYGYLAASPQPVPEPPAIATEIAVAREADQTLLIVAGGAFLVGLALVALRWVSRRLA